MPQQMTTPEEPDIIQRLWRGSDGVSWTQAAVNNNSASAGEMTIKQVAALTAPNWRPRLAARL
jgi:hypothetical protein